MTETGQPLPLVLFAHGDAAQLERARNVLAPHCRAVTVNTAADLLAMAQRDRPDLILCAAKLRARDGEPVWRALREWPDLAAIPLIAIAAADDGDAATAADDVLYEPFDDRELLARVATNLRFARERHAARAREAALKAEAEAMRKRIDTVLTHLPFGLTMVAPDEQILYANPARERLLGGGGRQPPGEHLAARLPARHGDGSPLHPDEYPIRRALKGELATDLEIRYEGADGSPRWLRASGIPVPGPDGQIQYAIGVAIDITAEVRARQDLMKLTESLEERVRSELDERLKTEDKLRQAQKVQVMGQLTGGVAHDFNNLLQVMLGNLQSMERLLQSDAPVDRARLSRLAAAAQRAVERATQTTQQLLAFSRRQSLDPATLDVNELLLRMAELFRHTLGGSILVETKLAPAVKPAYVDRNQLEAALLNLAVNARDAMPSGGRLIIASEDCRLAGSPAPLWDDFVPGDYALISVTDTGSGIPQDVMAHIFEPFFTTKEVGKGTGLGLSQVFGFAKQSGGHIVVESEIGAGTTMHLYLPAREAAANDEQEPLPPAADTIAS